MSKSKKPARRKAQKPKAAGRSSSQPTRRDILGVMGKGTAGLAVLGGAGYFGVGSFRAHAAEHDLTRIGQGAPVVVQVHDPQCPVCTTLQKQTRRALKSFSAECNLVYLVADIKTEAGSAFALRHGVPHVTLLLFDGAGQHMQTLSGPQTYDQLVPVFRAHKDSATT